MFDPRAIWPRATHEMHAETFLRSVVADPARTPEEREKARAALARLLLPKPTTYPRWLLGGPTDTAATSDCLLREVAPGLLVGSSLCPTDTRTLRERIAGTAGAQDRALTTPFAVVQFSRSCPVLHRPEHLRVPFEDFGPIPPQVLAAAVDFAHAWFPTRPVLVQCHAGLSRSASVAYALLRVVHGLTHDEALARVAHTVEHADRPARWPHPATLASAQAWCDARGSR